MTLLNEYEATFGPGRILSTLQFGWAWPEFLISNFYSVADPGCLSRIRIFSILDPGSAYKNLSIFTQKIVFKLSEIWSGLFIPDTDPDFLPIPFGCPGVKKAPDPGSATLNFYYYNERACTRGEAEKNLATSAFFLSRSAAFLRCLGARGRREGAAGDGVFSAELQIGHNQGWH